jgi:hypothetical protein
MRSLISTFAFLFLLTAGLQAKAPCPYPMQQGEFGPRYRQAARISFENQRLEYARTLVRSQCLDTWQVGELMRLFDFDRNRLELARFAYPQVTDPANYYQLIDLLTFSSHQQELHRFMAEGERQRGRYGPPAHGPAYGRGRDGRGRDNDRGDRARPYRSPSKPLPMRADQAADLMYRMPSDRERLAFGQRWLDRQPAMTQDLIVLLSAIDNRQDALDLAEHGYYRVGDPRNFDQVLKGFDPRARQELRIRLSRR